MADNTFNFDLDAPAVPTLTLDPAPAQEQAQPKQPEPAAAPEAQVKLSPEEQAMVDQFAEKIDITNSQQVLQYGSACQKKIGDFSEAALSKVSTKDLGEVGGMITDLIGELKNFDAAEEEKGILGFFRKKGNQLDNMKTKYSKAETNVETIQSALEKHQVQLLKDIAMLDKMYELNMAYFKELSMYILAGKKKLADFRAHELQQAMDKAKVSGLPEDAQAARDLADQCERFEKKLYDLELTRMVSIQTAPQIQPDRIGMIGLSYGGFYTMLLTALDTRIRAAMSACFFNTAQAHDEFSDCFWANSQNCFQDAELAALVYPRRLWIDAADGDELFPCNMARAELERLKAIRADGWDGLRFRIFKGVHEFPIDDTGIEYVVQALK